MSNQERKLLGGRVVLRPDDDGSFDELLLYDGDKCLVHAEMMDDKTLWIGIYPEGGKERVCMWINSRAKLRITATED